MPAPKTRWPEMLLPTIYDLVMNTKGHNGKFSINVLMSELKATTFYETDLRSIVERIDRADRHEYSGHEALLAAVDKRLRRLEEQNIIVGASRVYREWYTQDEMRRRRVA